MEQAFKWLAANWWWLTIILGVLVPGILNGISKYWGQCYGIKKVVMFLLEMCSLSTSAGARFVSNGALGKLKPPLWSVKPGVKR